MNPEEQRKREKFDKEVRDAVRKFLAAAKNLPTTEETVEEFKKTPLCNVWREWREV